MNNRAFHPDKVTLFLTDASSVPHVALLLRTAASSSATRNNVLVGCIGRDNWAIPALQIVVSTPEDAYDMLLRGVLSSLETNFIVLDDQASPDLDVNKVNCIRRILALESTEINFNFRARNQFFPRVTDEFQLPEMFLPSTSLSFDYCRGASLFAAGHSLVLQDACAVLAFMLCILRRVSSKSSQVQALLLAPAGKTEHLTGFMRSLAKHFGMIDLLVACLNSEEEKFSRGCHVGVATPDKLHRELQSAGTEPSSIEQLVIVELDQLGFTEVLCSILGKLPKLVQVGVQSEDIICSRLETVLQCLGHKPLILPRKSLSLNGVKQLVQRVRDDEEKVDVLVEICGCLKLSRTQVCAFCSTSDQVTWLGEELSKRGLMAFQARRNMSEAAVNEVKHSFDRGGGWRLLLTDMDSLQLSHIINFGVPASVLDYFNRVASYGGATVAVNLITEDEEQAVLDEVRQRFNVEIDEMPSDVFEAMSIV